MSFVGNTERLSVCILDLKISYVPVKSIRFIVTMSNTSNNSMKYSALRYKFYVSPKMNRRSRVHISSFEFL